MDIVVSFLLMCILSLCCLSIYGYGFFSWPFLLVAVTGIIVFSISMYTNKHNRTGTLLVAIFWVLEFSILTYALRMGNSESGMNFQQWLLTVGDEAKSSDYYLIVLATFTAAFFGFTVFYFVEVKYRVSLLTLVSIMPCVLYAKVIAEVDNYYLVLIAFLNLLAGIYHVRAKRYSTKEEFKRLMVTLLTGDEENSENNQVKIRSLTALLFTFIIIAVAAVLPRKQEAIYYDRFEELFLNTGKQTPGSEDLSVLNEISGNADSYQGDNNRRLFTIRGEMAPYMKRQNFDLYDYKNNYWTKDNELDVFRDPERLGDVSHRNLSLDRMVEAVNELNIYAPQLVEAHSLQGLLQENYDKTSEDKVYSLSIYTNNLSPEYYLQTARSVALVSHMGKNRWYNLYVMRDKGVGASYIDAGAGNMGLYESERFLQEAYTALEGKGNSSKCIKAFLDATSEAVYYRQEMVDNTLMASPRIMNLSDEITKGLTYDYEKAYAIQDYFYNGEFKYDLGYQAPDDSIEYFLFESKTGTCSEFATAYTLLARCAGLCVRYAEGFVPTSSSREDYYYIKESGSHAYPEVFLPMMGWMVFEPTISGGGGAPTLWDKIGLDVAMDYSLMWTIGIIGFCIAIAFLVLRTLFPLFSELVFRIGLLFVPKHKRPKKLYMRLNKAFARKYGRYILSLTPREFAAEYSDKKKGKKSIEDLVEALEKNVYAKKTADMD